MFMLWSSGCGPSACIVLSPTRCRSWIPTFMKIFNVQSAESSKCPCKNLRLKHLASPDMLTFNHYSHIRCWDTLISPHVKIVQSNNRWGKFLHISTLILRHYLFVWSDNLYLFSLLIRTGDIISAILGDLFSNFCYFSWALCLDNV
jgi:hypothetical protein